MLNNDVPLFTDPMNGELVTFPSRPNNKARPSTEDRLEPGVPFLTGTHKWEWILRADEAGAMLVAVHLLRLATMRGSDSIQFGAGRTAKELKMGRSTLYRKLEALQAGGLIDITRQPKVWPVVKLLGEPTVRHRTRSNHRR